MIYYIKLIHSILLYFISFIEKVPQNSINTNNLPTKFTKSPIDQWLRKKFSTLINIHLQKSAIEVTGSFIAEFTCSRVRLTHVSL